MSHAYNKLVIMSTSIKIKDHLISNGNINHSTFLEIVGIWLWELGVKFFLFSLYFFIMSGKYSK